jgi:hypothetical protein
MTSAAWGKGSTRRWRKLRALVLQRDGYVCRLRLEGCEGRGVEVHHVAGKAAGDNPALLLASCRSCNRKLGDPTKHRDPPARPLTQW